ncbi:MAG: tetratricopeptide repeat protein [Candidatus Omnitrophota bacterium]
MFKMRNMARKIFLVFLCLAGLFLSAGSGLYSAEDGSREEEAIFVAKKAMDDGFYEVGLGLLERFLKNYPNSTRAPEANLLIGECYFYQNRFIDALKKFEGLLSQPSLAQGIKDAVYYWIAEVHFKGNDFAKAMSYYKMIIDGFPDSHYSVYAYYSIGWCLFQEGRFSQALEYFRKTQEKFPKSPQAQDASFEIIECLYNLKDYPQLKENVAAYLKAYLKDLSRQAYLYFYAAEAAYYTNNYPEAISSYSKAMADGLDNKIKALSYLGTGWAYLKMKQYSQAEEAFAKLDKASLEMKDRDTLLLGRAILYQETKRFNEVKNICDTLLSSADPLILMQAYLNKADAFYNTADYKEAIKIYQEALDKSVGLDTPRELVDKLHYGLAWAYLKEGEFKAAIDAFQKIAEYSQDATVKAAALCQVGDTYQDSADYQKAVEIYARILKDYPDSFYGDYVQYQMGISLFKMSNYESAIMNFLSLRENFPGSKLQDDATYALALTYFQRENYKAAKEALDKFQGEFKESNLRPDALYLLGSCLYNMGNFTEAIEVFRGITRLYSQDSELLQKSEYEIADCYYQMGNEKEAMERFRSLRAKYPNSSLAPEVMWWLGEYYYRRNDYGLARRYFYSLIKDFSKSSLLPDAYYALGRVYYEEGNYPEAIANFRKVGELSKSDLAGQAFIALADIYIKQGQLESALSTYKEVTGLYPHLTNLVYPKIADIYLQAANYEEAAAYYKKSMDLVPLRQMPDIQFKIAEVRQAQGKVEDAIEEYLKVSYLYAEDNSLAVKAFLRVAKIYEDKEEFKEAGSIYKRIISMNTDEAKYAKERLDWINAHIKVK